MTNSSPWPRSVLGRLIFFGDQFRMDRAGLRREPSLGSALAHFACVHRRGSSPGTLGEDHRLWPTFSKADRWRKSERSRAALAMLQGQLQVCYFWSSPTGTSFSDHRKRCRRPQHRVIEQPQPDAVSPA